MSIRNDLIVALAGQQNAGKSTLFNLLTGARQHVANYPGVTVDKRHGQYRDDHGVVRTVDLPGTYSLTSFSLEERVARDFLLQERPDVVVDVADASNLRRSLHLTLQLLEMQLPVVLALNMMDVAAGRGLQIDAQALEQRLGMPVVATVGHKGEGRGPLRSAIRQLADVGAKVPPPPLTYGALETGVAALTPAIELAPELVDLPARWLSLKLLEGDDQALKLIAMRLGTERAQSLADSANGLRGGFEQESGIDVADHLVSCRDSAVTALLDGVVARDAEDRATWTDRIDRVVLNRLAAPGFLILTVFLIYQIAVVWGYELTNYTWPLLATLRELIADLLPAAGFMVDPHTRALGLWLVDSANTLLNYVPIFLLLFALIAILEDSGYMARIAFILDKILHHFGLHGQSTLPLVLGGVFAGGCAVPGVMATKGIPDNRARMATILTVPFMNCLAKIPLYTLLLGIFFVEHRSLMMFYISTITIVFGLLAAKLMTQTVLRGQETSPFVMELPAYHLPTIGGVTRRAADRTWLFIKKVGTIVLAVAVVVYSLLMFPGIPDERLAVFEARGQAAVTTFAQAMAGNDYQSVARPDRIVALANYFNDYKRAKLNAVGADASRAVAHRFAARSPEFFPLVKPPKGDKDARQANRALRKLAAERKTLRREIKEERITRSLLGTVGRGMETVTQYAGFDWKMNVALLSSFAARESSVATLGVLFQQDEVHNAPLEARMGAEARAAGADALTAVSIILFFALYPPCLATTVMVKIQTGSYRWMLFSIIFPTLLGLAVSCAVYSIGRATGATGIMMMSWTYVGALLLLVIVGLRDERGQPGRLRHPEPCGR